MLQMPPAVKPTAISIPKIPSVQFKYQLKLNRGGFLIASHMKHGYANVTGALVNPPNKPVNPESHGNATPIKKFVKT